MPSRMKRHSSCAEAWAGFVLRQATVMGSHRLRKVAPSVGTQAATVAEATDAGAAEAAADAGAAAAESQESTEATAEAPVADTGAASSEEAAASSEQEEAADGA